MTHIIRFVRGAALVALLVACGGIVAAGQADHSPFAVAGTLTCNAEAVDVIIVGIPQAEPGSEAAGRPGIAMVVGDTTRLVPKSMKWQRYVSGVLRAEGFEQWGFGVSDLTTCSQVIEFTGPSGNTVRTELEFQVLLTPAR
jgi:hypothetical protein